MSKRLFVAMLMVFIAAAAAFGQGSAVKSAAQNNPAAANKVGPLPNGKMAIIDSRAFPEGIGEYKKQLDKLEGEFAPRTKELETIQKRLVDLEEELKSKGPSMDPKIYQQKAEEMQGLKKEFERKREDYQQDLQKRSELVLGPVRDKVLKFLEGYASSHEIVMVFDLAPAAQAGLVFLNPGSNITDDFIKEYNQKNPVPSAPPQPAPARK
ncbi:MAG: OmpH family outer membrane protein, partial [Acidobacteriota bacterium]